jgi:hypothetical protein
MAINEISWIHLLIFRNSQGFINLLLKWIGFGLLDCGTLAMMGVPTRLDFSLLNRPLIL